MQRVVTVPGDKSITHRVLMVAALTPGRSQIRGALTAFDARSTARVLRDLGAAISPLRAGAEVVVEGRARFSAPRRTLDCGNSGTSARLLLGLLAGHPFGATVTGDRSLRRRPMTRVTDPLIRMGVRISGTTGDGLPLTIQGGALQPVRHTMTVASAQVKSAVLLAGLSGQVPVAVREGGVGGGGGGSRDHTERLLGAFGFALQVRDGWIEFDPAGGRLEPFATEIPGDPSSAAFLVAAALLGPPGGSVRVSGVGLNPTRIGFLSVLRRMGAQVETETRGTTLGEPVGDLRVTAGELRGTEVAASEVPGLIDEIPILAALAARCEGTTTFHDVGELRVKESDRLGLLARNLQTLGVDAAAEGDTLRVTGTRNALRGPIVTADDHRLAMAFGVLGTAPGVELVVDNPECAGVSFPDFWKTLSTLARG